MAESLTCDYCGLDIEQLGQRVYIETMQPEWTDQVTLRLSRLNARVLHPACLRDAVGANEAIREEKEAVERDLSRLRSEHEGAIDTANSASVMSGRYANVARESIAKALNAGRGWALADIVTTDELRDLAASLVEKETPR